MPETPDASRFADTPRGAGQRSPDEPRAVCWDLPHDLPIVAKVRAMVRETLTAWALRHLADDVVLVTGELLANAIVHGEPVVRLTLLAGADGLEVRVADRGSGRVRRLALDIEAVHGRGLAIVGALAHDHGVTPLPDRPGKTVWARWRLPPPGGSEA
ncbi:ATP-binding protein [Streptosporangium sp. NPDC050855]|uniref:ATP-binding protein n=1 Tax=Streptosporangium sp. NPDC050855 TaxID=3366194 RepID=UPI003792B9F3